MGLVIYIKIVDNRLIINKVKDGNIHRKQSRLKWQ